MNESTIIFNQQRHEKLIFKNPKSTVNNHRDKFKDQNRSTIFSHETSVNISYLTVRHLLLLILPVNLKD